MNHQHYAGCDCGLAGNIGSVTWMPRVPMLFDGGAGNLPAPPPTGGPYGWNSDTQSWVLVGGGSGGMGIIDGSNAAQGQIGECVEGWSPAGWIPVQITQYPIYTWTSVAYVDLTPGDWDISGETYWSVTAPMSNIIVAQGYLTTNLANPDIGYGNYVVLQPNFATAAGAFGSHQINAVSPVTIHAVASLLGFSAPDTTIPALGAGMIHARRMR